MRRDVDLEDLIRDYPDLKVVNCAGCGELLETRDGPNVLERVVGHIKERPYCGNCLRLGNRHDDIIQPKAVVVEKDVWARLGINAAGED